MKSKVKIDGDHLEITRVFDAPRDRVFDAWKQVDKLQQWWGCKEAASVESKVDFRPGGAFSHRMQIEDCGEFTYSGAFDEIIEPEKISWHADVGDRTERVTVEFIDQDQTTKLILTQDGFPDSEACEIISEGFSAAFDKLADVVLATVR